MVSSEGVQALGHEVLRELVGDGAHEGLVGPAGVALLAEDAREAAEKVLPPVQVRLVLRVADDALQHPQVLLPSLQTIH
jgi:hypothetical protein